jgi:hypothetical protein
LSALRFSLAGSEPGTIEVSDEPGVLDPGEEV